MNALVMLKSVLMLAAFLTLKSDTLCIHIRRLEDKLALVSEPPAYIPLPSESVQEAGSLARLGIERIFAISMELLALLRFTPNLLTNLLVDHRDLQPQPCGISVH